MNYEFSLVVPAYNEVKSLPELLKEYAEQKKGIKFQLVIVNNGSTDGTELFLNKIKKQKKYNFVKIVKIKKNIGYGYGVYQGLINADSSVIGWTHADLQTPTKDPFKAYAIYEKDKEKQRNKKELKVFIKGKRRKRSFGAKILSVGLQIFASIILLKRFNDINGQPKVFERELLQKCKRPPLGFSFDIYMQYIALKNKYKVHYFMVNFVDRKYGVSSWATTVFSKFSTIKSYLRDIWHMRTKKIC